MSSLSQPISQRQGNAAWWVLGILGIVLCAFVFIGLNIASYAARHTRLISSAQHLEISTPAGRIEIDKGSRHPAGLPVYPGALPKESDGARIEFPVMDGEKVALAAAKYYTSDSMDKVVAWYSDRLGTGFRRESPARDARQLIQLDASDADVSYISDDGDAVRIVGLTQRPGGVEIGLARMGKEEVQ